MYAYRTFCFSFFASFSKFQQEFQTFYKHSFRVADYLQIPGAKVKDLLEACKGIRVSRGVYKYNQCCVIAVLVWSLDVTVEHAVRLFPVIHCVLLLFFS